MYLHYSYIPYRRAMRRTRRVSKKMDKTLNDVAKYIIEEYEKFDSVSVQKAEEMLKE